MPGSSRLPAAAGSSGAADTDGQTSALKAAGSRGWHEEAPASGRGAAALEQPTTRSAPASSVRGAFAGVIAGCCR
jgi:hypothetical protein